MRKISSTVTYRVPSWNFCNDDSLLQSGTCRFCIKEKTGHRCALYDAQLVAKNGLIEKVPACCRATAGYPSTINEPPPAPQVQPKEIIKQAIDMYTKTVNDLVKQGYPQVMAENIARKVLLGGK